MTHHVQVRATRRHRLADYVTQEGAHAQKAVYIWIKADEFGLYLSGYSAKRRRQEDLLCRSVTPKFNFSFDGRMAATGSQQCRSARTAGKNCSRQPLNVAEYEKNSCCHCKKGAKQSAFIQK